MRNQTISLLCVLLTVTIYCGNKNISISKSDQGKTISVPLSSEFLVNLDANPSTGFAWEVLSIDSSRINFIEKSFFADDSLPGSGGREQIKFKAIHVGNSPVKLGYLRSWEGRGSMTDSFSVFIEVK